MNYPVIFIPGLFGSWGNDVIPGMGEFSFGFADFAYGPFVNSLENMGYKKDYDLFVCYYDWKLSVKDAVQKYLAPKIQEVLIKTNEEKVILIAHSLGGLLSRYYSIEINSNVIDKIIMLGTPNQGSVEAYYFWSGGELPYSQVEDNILYKTAKICLNIYYKTNMGLDYLEEVRKIFPVARDLLPSINYGNYLFTEENKIKTPINIENMDAKNEFLNELEKKYINPENLYIISGKNTSTNKFFVVKKNYHEKEKWADGKPILKYNTNMGDGTVTKDSTLGKLTYNNFLIDTNHVGLMHNSSKYVSEILKKTLMKNIQVADVEKVHIVYGNHKKINNSSIELLDGNVLSIIHHKELGNIDKNKLGKSKIITLDKQKAKINDKEILDSLLKCKSSFDNIDI